jgi:hypothetical protein
MTAKVIYLFLFVYPFRKRISFHHFSHIPLLRLFFVRPVIIPHPVCHQQQKIFWLFPRILATARDDLGSHPRSIAKI